MVSCMPSKPIYLIFLVIDKRDLLFHGNQMIFDIKASYLIQELHGWDQKMECK